MMAAIAINGRSEFIFSLMNLNAKMKPAITEAPNAIQPREKLTTEKLSKSIKPRNKAITTRLK